jgi:predicted RNA-binding Zn-ribbon protein involved in translation (DUF1610 family)
MTAAAKDGFISQDMKDFQLAVKAFCVVFDKQREGNDRGQFPCPKCGGEFTWWTVGRKRHVRGRCSNPGCLSFIQ